MGPFICFDHVQVAIPAESEDSAREFYIEALGFAEIPKPAHLATRGGIWLRAGGIHLHLGIDGDFHAARKAHPALRCTDYGELLVQLNARAVEVVEDPDPFQGARHCYVFDPFGNRIEFIEELSQ